MPRPRRLLATGVALAFTAATAHAGTMCFDPRAPGNGSPASAIVTNYAKPAKNACKTFAGWALYYDAAPVIGTACLNAAGTMLRVGYTVLQLPGELPIAVTLELPYPSLTNGRSGVRFEGAGGSSGSFAASASPCKILIP